MFGRFILLLGSGLAMKFIISMNVRGRRENNLGYALVIGNLLPKLLADR